MKTLILTNHCVWVSHQNLCDRPKPLAEFNRTPTSPDQRTGGTPHQGNVISHTHNTTENRGYKNSTCSVPPEIRLHICIYIYVYMYYIYTYIYAYTHIWASPVSISSVRWTVGQDRVVARGDAWCGGMVDTRKLKWKSGQVDSEFQFPAPLH